MSRTRKFKELRKAGTTLLPETQRKAAYLLSSLGGTPGGDILENYLSSVLLEVSPGNSHEDLLEHRGRKAMAQELLNMLLKDGPTNETPN